MQCIPVCTSINNIHFDSVPLSERASIIKTRTVMLYIQVLEPFQDFSSWLRRWWISFCRYWLGTCMVENVLEVFTANFNTFFADVNFNTFFVFLQQFSWRRTSFEFDFLPLQHYVVLKVWSTSFSDPDYQESNFMGTWCGIHWFDNRRQLIISFPVHRFGMARLTWRVRMATEFTSEHAICMNANCSWKRYAIASEKAIWHGVTFVTRFAYVPGSKLPLFPCNRGWSSTQ